MNEVCGYDADFVEVIPEHLKCVICHMVLKDAMQLAACGHRYCKDCFNELKSYSNHRNQQLACPIDRRNIDITRIFPDKAIQRIILDLKVFCDHRSSGCHWSGELRELQTHLNNSCAGAKEKVDLKLMQSQIAELQRKVSVLEHSLLILLTLFLLLICYICFVDSKILFWLIVLVTLFSGPFLLLKLYH